MNRIYKVIYSKVRSCYVVVSELAKNNSKGTSRGAVVGNRKGISRLAAVLAAGVMAFGALPGIAAADSAIVTDAKGNILSTDAKTKDEIAEDPSSFPQGSGQSIAIGKDAYAFMQGGTKAYFMLFGEKKATGSIAIGEGAQALSQAIAIGNRVYTGDLGDVTISKYNNALNGAGVGSVLLGSNSYTGGTLSTLMGDYSIMSTSYPSGNSGAYTQNAGALSIGALNSIESASSKSKISGIANSIVGLANRTQNANGALIYGAGNEITNSIAYASAPISGSSAKAAADSLRKSVKTSPGGAVLAIGGGNTADWAQSSQLMGVNNTLKGTEKSVSKYNLIDGYHNTGTNVSNSKVIGSSNTLNEGASSNTIIGDQHTLAAAKVNNVILGNSDKALTTSVSNAVLLGHNADVQKDGGVAVGDGSVASTDKGVVGYDLKGEDHSSDTTGTWKSTAAAVSVGDAVNKMTRQITNVAAGTADTDAVNVAQLKNVVSLPVHIYSSGKMSGDSYTAGSNVSNLSIGNLQFDFGDGLKAEEVTADGSKRVLVSLDKDALKGDPDFKGDKGDKGDTGAQGEQGFPGERGSKGDKGDKGDTGARGEKGDKGDPGKDGKDGGVGTVVGDNTNITVANTETDATKPANYKVSLNKQITVDKVTAGDTTVSSDGVSIAGGPSMTKDGIDAGGSKITNVAAGTADTDAVNYGQLKGVESNVQDNTTNINRLNGRVNDLDSRVNKVGAGAAALAALHPQDFNPDDKWDFAVGYGNYRDANAMAIGAFYRPDENVMFSMGTNFGNGENMINAGVTFKLGPKNHTTSNKYLLSKEVTTLRATVAQQDAQLKQQSSEIRELREMVSKLLAKTK